VDQRLQDIDVGAAQPIASRPQVAGDLAQLGPHHGRPADRRRLAGGVAVQLGRELGIAPARFADIRQREFGPELLIEFAGDLDEPLAVREALADAAVAEPPRLRALRRDVQIEAAGIAQLAILRLRLGFPALQVCEQAAIPPTPERPPKWGLFDDRP
jgi:hypothetical protein